MKPKKLIISLLIANITITSAANNIAHAQRYEKPTILKASQLLPASLLKGPHHKVAERVTSDGYFNNYTIESKFGNMTVEGRELLEIRVGEMSALAELDKLACTDVFADAAYKSGKGIVMAPVKLVEKTAKVVSDPQKMADTLSAIPDGAERLFSWAYRKGKSAAQAVSDAVSSDSEAKDKEKKADSDQSNKTSTSDAIDQGTNFGLRYIGYTKRQREWFRRLQVNPYTSNETLRDEIMRVAGIETAVGTAFKFVPGLGLLGELATFNTWYERAEKLSLYEDPDTISKKNQKELLALGVSEELAKKFQSNKAYTPWSRRFISASLTALGPKVTGHSEFIRAACEATNEPSTLYFVSIGEAFEKLHAVTPIKKLTASMYLPAAVTSSGVLYVPLPVDYLFWTEEVAGIFRDFEKRVLKPNNAKRAHVNIFGRASPMALDNLRGMGVEVAGS